MEANFKFPRISMLWRFILLPIFFIWWLYQLFIFSFCGGIFVLIFGMIGIFSELGVKKDKRDWNDALFLISMPFVYPIVWWIRYFKFGEYNTLD